MRHGPTFENLNICVYAIYTHLKSCTFQLQPIAAFPVTQEAGPILRMYCPSKNAERSRAPLPPLSCINDFSFILNGAGNTRYNVVDATSGTPCTSASTSTPSGSTSKGADDEATMTKFSPLETCYTRARFAGEKGQSLAKVRGRLADALN